MTHGVVPSEVVCLLFQRAHGILQEQWEILDKL